MKPAMEVDQTGNSLDAIVRTYRSLGVVALQNFVSTNDLTELSRNADDLIAKYRNQDIEDTRVAYRPKADGGQIFERFDPVCDLAPACETLSRDPRILELASRIIDDEPFLLKDKLLYKLEGDNGYRLHQDYPYYGLSERHIDEITTIAVAINDISQEDGALSFALACHDKIQPAPRDNPKDVDPSAIADVAKWEAVLPKGSLIAFHGLTPHSSGENRSRNTRRVLYLTYIRKELGFMRDKYYEMRATQLRTARSKSVN